MKLSCKEVSFLISESLDRTLSLRERLGVKVHLLMCRACQRMARQTRLLRDVARRHGSSGEDSPSSVDQTLSEEARARILARLQRATQGRADHE